MSGDLGGCELSAIKSGCLETESAAADMVKSKIAMQ